MNDMLFDGSIFEGSIGGYIGFAFSVVSLFWFVPLYGWLMVEIFKRKNFDPLEAIFPWFGISILASKLFGIF